MRGGLVDTCPFRDHLRVDVGPVVDLHGFGGGGRKIAKNARAVGVEVLFADGILRGGLVDPSPFRGHLRVDVGPVVDFRGFGGRISDTSLEGSNRLLSRSGRLSLGSGGGRRRRRGRLG